MLSCSSAVREPPTRFVASGTDCRQPPRAVAYGAQVARGHSSQLRASHAVASPLHPKSALCTAEFSKEIKDFMETKITAALIGIASALITAFITKSTADKKNAIENITQERKKWRDDMRAATVALRRCVEATLRKEVYISSTVKESKKCISFLSVSEARAFFVTRLNPIDPEDSNILGILEKIIKKASSTPKRFFSRSQGECLHCCQFNLYLDGDDNDELLCLLCQFEQMMSVLLKYDWERAKREVYGRSWIKWLTAGILISLGLFFLKDVKIEFSSFQPISFLLFKISSLVTGFFLIYALLFGPVKNLLKKIMPIEECFCLYKIFNIPFRQKLPKKEITSEGKVCPCCWFVVILMSFFLTAFIVFVLKSIFEMQ